MYISNFGTNNVFSIHLLMKLYAILDWSENTEIYQKVLSQA